MSRRLRRIWWLTVSNAAERSRRTRREGDPESEEMRWSLVTLNNAVSVLWAEFGNKIGMFQTVNYVVDVPVAE